jgi:hypothetical protein
MNALQPLPRNPRLSDYRLNSHDLMPKAAAPSGKSSILELYRMYVFECVA